MIEVYVDDYISLAIPRTREDLRHVANAVMKSIHDVFPPDDVDGNDPISHKMLLKQEGMWALTKDILGFTFDGEKKTIWLEAPKREKLLTTLKTWITQAERRMEDRGTIRRVSIDNFETAPAFVSIPSGKGLLSPCNTKNNLQWFTCIAITCCNKPSVIAAHCLRSLHCTPQRAKNWSRHGLTMLG